MPIMALYWPPDARNAQCRATTTLSQTDELCNWQKQLTVCSQCTADKGPANRPPTMRPLEPWESETHPSSALIQATARAPKPLWDVAIDLSNVCDKHKAHSASAFPRRELREVHRCIAHLVSCFTGACKRSILHAVSQVVRSDASRYATHPETLNSAHQNISCAMQPTRLVPDLPRSHYPRAYHRLGRT